MFAQRNKSHKLKKINVIKKLKDYKNCDEILLLLKEFKKKQESDYFLTNNSIKIGKINAFNQKFEGKSKYSFVGYPNSPKRKQSILHQNSFQYKYIKSKSISTSKIERFKSQNALHISKNNTIDSKSLKSLYNEARQRINDEKNKKEDRHKLLIELPDTVRKSLIYQENIFKKLMREKKIKKTMQEKIKKKCNKKAISELLINKSRNFDRKNEELSIIENNKINSYKYKENLWNITLRNSPINGKYETMGYFNIGNKYQPMYAIFELNKNSEIFNNPEYEKNKTEKNRTRNNKLFSTLSENNYNVGLKKKLHFLNNIKNLEIKGENLLDFEDKRENDNKSKKIIYNKQDLDYLIFKNKDRSKNEKEFTNEREIKSTLDEIYEEKYFARNYTTNDFLKERKFFINK